MAKTGNGNGEKKLAEQADALRKQGATAAIICHTLNVPYSRAVGMAADYDKRHGHTNGPSVLVRKADGIKAEGVLAGLTIKDGTGTATGKAKAAPKKASKKASGKASAKTVNGNGKAKAAPKKRVAQPTHKGVPVAQPSVSA